MIEDPIVEEEIWAELSGAAWTVDEFVAERREEARQEWRRHDETEAKA